MIKKLSKNLDFWADQCGIMEDKCRKLERENERLKEELENKTYLWSNDVAPLMERLNKRLEEGSEINIKITNPDSQSSSKKIISDTDELPEEGYYRSEEHHPESPSKID